MGPRQKRNPTKFSVGPLIDPQEVVSEVDREFFEFQLEEIEKKLERIGTREDQLTEETKKLEEKIEEVKKEQGEIITEHKRLFEESEQNKIRVRGEAIKLQGEIKIQIENHQNHIKGLRQKIENMVTELTSRIEALEEEVKVLEDFKHRKSAYVNQNDELEKEMEGAEMQHQRNLFEIETKSEMVKARMKKEIQLRLLNLSIEFQQTSQKKIGKSCHRVIHENKAIHNALEMMNDEIREFQEKRKKTNKIARMAKNDYMEHVRKKEKLVAKIVIQRMLLENLIADRLLLVEKLKTYSAVDSENKSLQKKFKALTNDIHAKQLVIDDLKRNIHAKSEDIAATSTSSSLLRRKLRKLNVLIRGALKVVDEAATVRLIPLGEMEEERFVTTEAKVRLFRKRRDLVFAKKGKILQYLFDFILKAQPTEEDRKLLKVSSESIETMGDLDMQKYYQMYGRVNPLSERLSDAKETPSLVGLEEERKGPIFYLSDNSLPRSVSTTAMLHMHGVEYEGEFEGEFDEEFEGEFEGDFDRKTTGLEEDKELEKLFRPKNLSENQDEETQEDD